VRLYFHLTSAHDVIRDPEGVDVADLQDALLEATKTVEELRQADEFAAMDWSGWRLDVTDAAGRVLFSLDLDTPVH
jgi:hypothetical protein